MHDLLESHILGAIAFVDLSPKWSTTSNFPYSACHLAIEVGRGSVGMYRELSFIAFNVSRTILMFHASMCHASMSHAVMFNVRTWSR
jgi:hypothetical protein